MIETARADRLTFVRASSGRFQIGPDALETIVGFAQDEPFKLEAGGVLLGRHIINTNDIVVDQVTNPMPRDRCRRSRFVRARRLHQELIDHAWKESDGTCTYLGEWHTHPEPVPTRSMVDRIDWLRKLMVDEFSEFLFFVIAGTDAIAVWEGVYRRTHLQILRQVT